MPSFGSVCNFVHVYTIVVVYAHGAVVAYVVMCLGEQML